MKKTTKKAIKAKPKKKIVPKKSKGAKRTLIPDLNLKNKMVYMKVGKPVGKVTHYFSDISVGVIKLSAPLSEGDEIRIMGGENTDFNQEVKSMQVEHEPLKKAKKGDSVGLKVKEKVRDGYHVYKV